jgi:hypothetical protein
MIDLAAAFCRVQKSVSAQIQRSWVGSAYTLELRRRAFVRVLRSALSLAGSFGSVTHCGLRFEGISEGCKVL